MNFVLLNISCVDWRCCLHQVWQWMRSVPAGSPSLTATYQ